MKKFIALLLSATLTISLAGCGSSKAPAPATAPAASSAPAEKADGSQSGAPAPAAPQAPAASTPAASSTPAYREPQAAPATSQEVNRLWIEGTDIKYQGAGQDYNLTLTRQPEAENNEDYLEIFENQAVDVSENSMLTFGLKVDTASYTNVRRYIESNQLPPADAVKVEEFINYFSYDMEMPKTNHPFSIYTELGRSPFDSNKHLAFVRVKARDIDKENLPDSNLTFLIDTSGSMDTYDKLPLLKSAFRILVETLDENDVVSIVTYAGSSKVVLDSVSCNRKDIIIDAIENLKAGGGTAGADGINTAYKLAEKNFVPDGNNRILIASDGDFNVGISSLDALNKLISDKRQSGVYLSVLGFGTGNIRDDIMETLAKNGNGNYSYIDSTRAAQKVLVDEATSNLFAIADDVKAQVEFNPALVKSYRLIGYENRMLENKDFKDDKKDSGEIGIGTDVVVMFEVELNNSNSDLKYQTERQTTIADGNYGDELFEVRIRYKNPGESKSIEMTDAVKVDRIFDSNSSDFDFASSIASYCALLRNSEFAGSLRLSDIISTAKNSLGYDTRGYRADFIEMLEDSVRLGLR